MDFFNKNWKEHLKKGDKIIAHTQIAPAMVWINSLIESLAFGLALLIMLFAFFIQFFTFFSSIFGILIFIIFAGAVLSLPVVASYLSGKSAQFALTSSGVYSVYGFIFKKTAFVAYNRITDATIKRGLFDQIFDTGTVGISTAGGTKINNGISQPYEILITSVKDYKKIRELIFDRMK